MFARIQQSEDAAAKKKRKECLALDDVLPTVTPLTIEFGSEAETVVALALLVPVAIVTNTGGGIFASTLVPGMSDRVLD